MASDERDKVVSFAPKSKVLSTPTGVPATLGPLNPATDVTLTMSDRLIDLIEAGSYEGAGGPLKNSIEWQELRRRLGYPSPPIPNQTDKDPA